MALTKDQKTAQVKELTKKFQEAKSVMFAHYIGLKVDEIGELRAKLREEESEMKVAKKTLMKLAAKEVGMPELSDDVIEGPVSCIFSFADPLSGAQVAFKFSKDHDKVALIGGFYDGKMLTKEEATELAKLPSREVLLATFMGMLNSPLTSFAGMCSSPLSGFAQGLKQMAEKSDDGDAGDDAKPEEATEDSKESEETKEEEATDTADEPKKEDAEASSDSSDDSSSSSEASAKEDDS